MDVRKFRVIKKFLYHVSRCYSKSGHPGIQNEYGATFHSLDTHFVFDDPNNRGWI